MTLWHQAEKSETWFAMSATHVIAQIRKVEDKYHARLVGPGGLGLSIVIDEPQIENVLIKAEWHLRDLGWKAATESFVPWQ